VFENLGEAIAAGSSVVYDIAVPADAVLDLVEALPTESGVLIQKPLGRDREEARRIREACERRRLKAAVNFQLRFSPGVLAVRDALSRGLLGELRDVDVRVNVHTPWAHWAFLKGIPRHEILYHSIHYLDLVRCVLGDPRGALSQQLKHPELEGYSDTRSSTIVDYGDRCRACLSINHSHDFGAQKMASEIKFEGTEGAAICSMGVNLDYPRGQPDTLEVAFAPSRSWRTVPLRGSWFIEAFEGPMSNLQRYVAGEDESLVSAVGDAEKTMQLVEACYLSQQRGSVPIPS
jgi:predicted dehydrogenase